MNWFRYAVKASETNSSFTIYNSELFECILRILLYILHMKIGGRNNGKKFINGACSRDRSCGFG